PPENKVVVERYADFLEREFILQKESGTTVELDDEDTIPFENTSEHLIEAESLAPIIEEEVVPVRRSARTPKETFSPVADIRAIRIPIDITAYYDYEIWQMNVKTAFLNGFLDEKIYMEQPEGFVDPDHPRKEMLRIFLESRSIEIDQGG
nr:retrotransposon protein, putative, Ty1-copia subclass [Tanacetum cinerariifolium]